MIKRRPLIGVSSYDDVISWHGWERTAATLVAEGRSTVAIARRLVISEKAVVSHVSRIYEQLGLADSPDDHRRVLAVMRFLAR